MKNLTFPILLLAGFLSGCIKEDLKECPPESGNLKINIYAEKFQTTSENPLQDTEEKLNRRISSMFLQLSRNDTIVETQTPDIRNNSTDAYLFESKELPLGRYSLRIVANKPSSGDFTITYPGADQTQDYFAVTFPFELDCNCTTELSTKLQRLQGVVLCRLNNLPATTSEIEISLKGITKNWLLKDKNVYSDTMTVTRRINLTGNPAEDSISMTLGTFPTPEGQKATYTIRLFRKGESQPFFTRTADQQIEVKRNQLTELLCDFSNNSFNFEIRIDSRWEDALGGGILL